VLGLAWALFGVWSVGHALEHALDFHEQEHRSGDHVVCADADRLVELTDAHGHGHAHPQLLSALAGAKPPELESPDLLAISAVVSWRPLSSAWDIRFAPALRSRDLGAVSGPRAPPPVS